MTPIPFRQNPAFVTVGDGIGLAAVHLRNHLVLWLVPVLAYAAISGALSLAITARLLDELAGLRTAPGAVPDRAALDALGASLAASAPALVGYGVLLLLGGLALAWLMYALAVGGLPGRTMTADRAVAAGLRTILAFLLALVASVAVMVVAVVAFAVVADRLAILLLLLVPAAIAVSAWCLIRLALVPYALFDGQGVIQAIVTSWTLTRGAVLRTLGWLLLFMLIGFGVSIVASVIGAPFGDLPVVGVVVSGVLTTALQFLTAVALGILYESQRMRWVMATPGAPWLPGEPAMPVVPAAVAAVPPAPAADSLLPPPPPPPPAW